ncbi:tripartite tricarboxylate transporter substrate-binding protein, partial [Chloroflexota bacterium]
EMPFELAKFEYICQNAIGIDTVAVAAHTSYYSVADLQKATAANPVIICTDEVEPVLAVFTSQLGIPHSYVVGYEGSAESILGAIREDGDMVVFTSADLAPHVEAGDLRPILVLGGYPDPVWQGMGLDVPIGADVGQPELAVFNSPKLIAAPPGTPADVVATLEEAFRKASQDPELLKWEEESGRPIEFADGKAASEVVIGLSELYHKYGEILIAEVEGD